MALSSGLCAAGTAVAKSVIARGERLLQAIPFSQLESASRQRWALATTKGDMSSDFSSGWVQFFVRRRDLSMGRDVLQEGVAQILVRDLGGDVLQEVVRFVEDLLDAGVVHCLQYTVAATLRLEISDGVCWPTGTSVIRPFGIWFTFRLRWRHE